MRWVEHDYEVDSEIVEDDDYDRRPQRRRYEEPAHIRVRKQLLSIAESVISPVYWLLHDKALISSKPVKKTEDEISSIAKTVADGFEDEELKSTFTELAVQL